MKNLTKISLQKGMFYDIIKMLGLVGIPFGIARNFHHLIVSIMKMSISEKTETKNAQPFRICSILYIQKIFDFFAMKFMFPTLYH